MLLSEILKKKKYLINYLKNRQNIQNIRNIINIRNIQNIRNRKNRQNIINKKIRQNIINRQNIRNRQNKKNNLNNLNIKNNLNNLNNPNIINNLNKPKLCIVAIFKNESHILKEWLEHYINEGVDKFFMIDNGSNDNYMNILKPYILNNKVELIIDNKKHSQKLLYNKYYLTKCKMYEWVIVVDLDEFIYARKDCKKITDYLNILDDSISQVFIPWKIFGSNGINSIYDKQPTNVIKSFTKRTNYNKEANLKGVITKNNTKYGLAKCIVKTKYLLKLNIHSHETSNKNYITSDNEINNI
jgi:hypothetical protein